MGVHVRPAVRSDIPALSAVLAEAFEDDPLMAWMLPDEATRADRLTKLFAAEARYHHLAGGGVEVATDDNGLIGGRSGYEYFRDSDTYTFFQAQWFPRLVAYTDYTGWQHKQFLGTGEFTLEFGNYDVSITVPADHIVSATGVLQNPNDVLTAEQRGRAAQEVQRLRSVRYLLLGEIHDNVDHHRLQERVLAKNPDLVFSATKER